MQTETFTDELVNLQVIATVRSAKEGECIDSDAVTGDKARRIMEILREED